MWVHSAAWVSSGQRAQSQEAGQGGVVAQLAHVRGGGHGIVPLDGVGLAPGEDDRPARHLGLGPVRDGGALGGGLQHDAANIVDALGDGVGGAGDGDGPLGGVWQHLGGHLDRGARHLADFLDLAARLADERAALGRRHDQAQSDGRPLLTSAAAAVVLVHLTQELLKLGTDEFEGGEDAVSVASNGDDPLGAGPIANVDLCTGLFSKSLDYLSFLSNDASDLLSLHQESHGE